uniref:Pept_C1 domain-containing protein n=1 Tax=Panagrellus redivivus TaxID=6233 RepID=A0A7E4VKS4_PANRE
MWSNGTSAMHTLFWIAVIASVGSIAVALTDLEQWQEFKIKFGKNYPDPVENAYHYAIFQQSLKEVKENNAKYEAGEVTYSIKLVPHSDIPKDQRRKFPPLPIPKNLIEDDISEDVGNKTVPESIDWREKGYVTHIKNQGECEDCWVFAGVASLEALYKRKTGKLDVLSEQNIRECYPDFDCPTGGLPSDLFDFVGTKQGGLLDPEKYYPYNDTLAKCRFDEPDADNTTVRTNKQFTGEDELKKVVGTVGPVSVGIYASEAFKNSDGSVVYDPDYKKGTDLNHAVLVVGYGTDKKGGDYWLIKNSWGTDVGDKGYFKLARNRDGNLGIGEYCTYPV